MRPVEQETWLVLYALKQTVQGHGTAKAIELIETWFKSRRERGAEILKSAWLRVIHFNTLAALDDYCETVIKMRKPEDRRQILNIYALRYLEQNVAKEVVENWFKPQNQDGSTEEVSAETYSETLNILKQQFHNERSKDIETTAKIFSETIDLLKKHGALKQFDGTQAREIYGKTFDVLKKHGVLEDLDDENSMSLVKHFEQQNLSKTLDVLEELGVLEELDIIREKHHSNVD